VKVAGTDITELARMPITKCLAFFKNLKLPGNDAKVAERLVKEITEPLALLGRSGRGLPDLGPP
jgi:excinuclease UvrABC ATPase subunit